MAEFDSVRNENGEIEQLIINAGLKELFGNKDYLVKTERIPLSVGEGRIRFNLLVKPFPQSAIERLKQGESVLDIEEFSARGLDVQAFPGFTEPFSTPTPVNLFVRIGDSALLQGKNLIQDDKATSLYGIIRQPFTAKILTINIFDKVLVNPTTPEPLITNPEPPVTTVVVAPPVINVRVDTSEATIDFFDSGVDVADTTTSPQTSSTTTATSPSSTKTVRLEGDVKEVTFNVFDGIDNNIVSEDLPPVVTFEVGPKPKFWTRVKRLFKRG